MHEHQIKELSEKIGIYTKQQNKKSLIIHCTNSYSSVLCTQLAIESKKTNNIKVFCVFFGSSVILDSCNGFSNTDCKIIKIPSPELDKTLFTHIASNDIQKLQLQKNLIQAVLVHYANVNNGLVVGTLDKSTYGERLYFKYGEGLADFFPILHLFNSDCEKIIKEALPEYVYDKVFEEDYRFYLEWAIKENEKTGILESQETPNNNKLWFKYTMNQKNTLAHLHQRWKDTKHKKSLTQWPDDLIVKGQ